MSTKRARRPWLLQRPAAKGYRDRQLRQITIGFDDAQFAAIAALAKREGTCFAEQVRTLCEWGLAEVKDE